MVWYYSGKFDSMRVIIYESSICTSIFHRYFLSSSISVIHSLEFLVMPSILHLENYLCSILLEAPVVESNFCESFIHTCLVSHYLLSFFFDSSVIRKQTVFLVWVSACCRLSCWETSNKKLIFLLFCLRHLLGFYYHLLVGHCIPWFQIFPWSFPTTYVIYPFHPQRG